MSQYLATSCCWPSMHGLLDFRAFPGTIALQQEVLKVSRPHVGLTPPFLFPPVVLPSFPSLLIDYDSRSPKACHPTSQGSTPLHHARLHIHAFSSARSNALRTSAVSFTGLLFVVV
jgi:hypothetical protein